MRNVEGLSGGAKGLKRRRKRRRKKRRRRRREQGVGGCTNKTATVREHKYSACVSVCGARQQCQVSAKKEPWHWEISD